nr:signal peptidase I [Leifsonia sp. Leaf325]
MRMLRGIGGALLWATAALGVLSGALWIAHALGWVQPLVVVSGSMEPGIRRGDLLFALPVPATDVDVGEVTSLPSPLDGVLVTHRVIEVTPEGESLSIRMEGDANGTPDGQPYPVPAASSVWQPMLTVPGAGTAVIALSRPAVAIPLAVAVLALIALTLLPPPSPRQRARESEVT